ncbi:MAG: DUF5618 family protein [Dysgonamonadaceae bacterium]|nr:DUF5618 family protein [Dysgonamonadaceae bacterium]
MKKAEFSINEAERYIQNARQILSEKAKKDGKFYGDHKYVKMAGHTAWCGVLVALDTVLDVRDKLKKNQRPEYRDYLDAVYKKDTRLVKPFQVAYDILHKSLGYDGTLSYAVAQEGLEVANSIIEWASEQEEGVGKRHNEC